MGLNKKLKMSMQSTRKEMQLAKQTSEQTRAFLATLLGAARTEYNNQCHTFNGPRECMGGVEELLHTLTQMDKHCKKDIVDINNAMVFNLLEQVDDELHELKYLICDMHYELRMHA